MLTCIQLFLLLAPPAGTNFFQQGGGGDRLQGVTVDHAMAAGIHDLTGGAAGHHDAGQSRVLALNGHAELHAAAAGQALVDGQGVKRLGLQQGAYLAPAGAGEHFQAKTAEIFLQQIEHFLVVVGRQDAQLVVHAPLHLFQGALLLQHGQVDIERCPLAKGALGQDMAPMGADDLLRQCQAQAGALALLLVVKNGSKMWASVSLSMPQPVSVTLTRT